MPRFDAYNRTAAMDLHGRRIAREGDARVARGRKAAQPRRSPVAARWTRSCYCGQEVEPGHSVSDTPFWGLRVLRRLGGRCVDLPRAGLDRGPAPARGCRRIPSTVARSSSRAGSSTSSSPRCTSCRWATGCCSARRESRASRWAGASRRPSRPELPSGVTEPVVVGLANNYMGYLTTPEEYEMQHYEGGHTVYGVWTSLARAQLADRAHPFTRARGAGARPRRAAGAGRHRTGRIPGGRRGGCRDRRAGRNGDALRHGLDRMDRQRERRRPAG